LEDINLVKDDINQAATLKLTNKFILFLGSSTFGILALFSLHFYKERAFFLDLSYILYLIIKDNCLAIQVNRFVSFFTQGVAYSAMKLGLPLENIAQLYSLSFVVFQYLIFLVILKIAKDKWMALGLVLFNTLMVTHTFYWPTNELLQGMAVLFLFFALLNKSYNAEGFKKLLVHLLAIGSLITTCFAHPLLNIPVAFGLILIATKDIKQLKSTGLYFIGLVSLYIIKQIYFSNYYDAYSMEGLENFIKLFPNYYTESMHNFFNFLIRDYYLFMLALIACTIFYIKERKFLRLALVLLSVVVYTLMINVSFPKNVNQFYIEAQYLILSVFVILPLVLDIIPSIKNEKLLIAGISIVLIISLIRIYSTHDLYTERLEWNRNLLAKSRAIGKDKLILMDKELPKETLLLTWAMAYETWIMSTVENGATQSIVALKNEKKLDEFMDQRKVFLSKWIQDTYFKHPRKYFIFPDTMNTYRKFSLEEIIGKQKED